MGNLTYDPLIWLKVTSLLSTASVLREYKISQKLQELFKKHFFKTSIKGDFSLYTIDFKTLSGNFSGLNDLNSPFGL